MAIDFTKIINEEIKKQEAAESQNSGSSGFKTVYPFSNGRLEMKLIANEQSGLIYREITFHEYYSDNKKKTVPCLHEMYGIECPICNATRMVSESGNKDVFKKYGYKKRGIMFAKLLGHTPDNYFGDSQNPPKPNEIVLFMFPKAVINELRNLILEYQDELDNIFANNTTRCITLKIGTQANGFPEYNFFVKGNSHTHCLDENNNPDDVEFSKFMSQLPNLKEVKYPSEPTEEMYKTCKAIAEEIEENYFGKAIDRPRDSAVSVSEAIRSEQKNVIEETVENNKKEEVEETVSNNVETSKASSTEGSKPECFGDNKYDEVCAKCPWEAQCI